MDDESELFEGFNVKVHLRKWDSFEMATGLRTDLQIDRQLAFLWEQNVPHYWLTCFSINSYENEFLDNLIKEGKRRLARKFNLSYCYIDDLISFNNKRFNEIISDIYPKELTISETTESTSVASYLDLLFTRDENNNITTKLYYQRDAFGFHIVNFPFMSSNIPSAPA